jgi:hypothetical protein
MRPTPPYALFLLYVKEKGLKEYVALHWCCPVAAALFHRS